MISTLTKVALVSAFAVSGCATVMVPVDREVRASRVCGNMAGRHGCAPTVGIPMPFNKVYRNITVTSGEPDILTYLGRTVPVGDNTGNAGVPCGFTQADRPAQPASQTNFSLSYSVAQKLGSSFAVDIDQAFALAQIPKAVSDRVQAEISATANSVDNQTISVTAQVAEHPLLITSLDRLDAREGLSPLQSSCADRIASGEHRLVQAVAALYVPRAAASYEASYDAIGALGLALQAQAVPATTIAGVTGDLKQRAQVKLDVAVLPYYSVIGVSYWRPLLLNTAP